MSYELIRGDATALPIEATPQAFLEALWAVAACSPPMLQPRRQRDPATAAAWGAAYRMPFMPAPHPRPAGHRPGLLPPLRGVARRRRTEVVEISRFVVDVRDGLWLDNDMTTEQITWAKVGQFTWTADHYGNDVEVWLDDNGYWGWRVMWNGGSDRGWADTMEDAKAEATR